jgi:formylglycine-generating enzyme required for sulfatase activity
MHGNAWEWVGDCTPTKGDRFEISEGCAVAGILRGGSWANNYRELGSPARRMMVLTWRRNHMGFRVALSLGD